MEAERSEGQGHCQLHSEVEAILACTLNLSQKGNRNKLNYVFVWLVSLRGQTGETENLPAKDLHTLKYKVFRLAPTRKSVVLRGFEKTNSCGIHFCNDIWITLPPKAPVTCLILRDSWPFWRPVPPPQEAGKGYHLGFLGGAVSLSWSAQNGGFLVVGGVCPSKSKPSGLSLPYVR